MGVGVGQVVGRFDALHVIATCLIEVNHLRRSRQLYTPFKSQSVNLLPLVCYSTPSLRHPAMQVCLISDLGFVLSQLHHLLLRLSVSDDSRHQDTNSLDLVLVDRARSITSGNPFCLRSSQDASHLKVTTPSDRTGTF